MYATLSQFKNYLGITDNTQDLLLTDFLNSAYNTINKYCGVKSFNLWDYEELIDVRGIYSNNYWLFFYVSNKPVNTVKEINNIAYEWVKGQDYLVVNERELIFTKLPETNLGYLHIKYNSWYATVPDDIKLCEMMLASGLYQQHGNEGVSSYKLWDEQITFWGTNSEGELAYFKVKTLLDKYKNFSIPY